MARPPDSPPRSSAPTEDYYRNEPLPLARLDSLPALKKFFENCRPPRGELLPQHPDLSWPRLLSAVPGCVSLLRVTGRKPQDFEFEFYGSMLLTRGQPPKRLGDFPSPIAVERAVPRYREAIRVKRPLLDAITTRFHGTEYRYFRLLVPLATRRQLTHLLSAMDFTSPPTGAPARV